ncbi:MAG: TolC family protein [Sulfurovum sp.]|nr:TolC family protein [Sulfurovum sp.]
MKIFTFLLLGSVLGSASSLSLKEILNAANHNNPLANSIAQQRLFLHAKNLSETASDPIELHASSSYARPMGISSVLEYSMGISQNIKLSEPQALDKTMTQLNNEASLIDESKKRIAFSNGIKNLYHQHCLDRRNYESVQKSYQDFVTLFEKKKKAYEYQEVSKMELMQLEIEAQRLQSQLEAIQREQQLSRSQILGLSRIPLSSKKMLYCQDGYPIKNTIHLPSNAFSLSTEAYNKRQESSKTAFKRASKHFDSLTLSVEYSNEYEMDKYRVGVSIPLHFGSTKSQEARVAALHQNTSLGFAYEEEMLQKKTLSSTLRSQLKSDALRIQSLKDRLQTYKKELLPLLKRSYLLGESTVIEYLLNRQNYYQEKQNLFARKKAYYHTLFSLYTLHEIKDNK